MLYSTGPETLLTIFKLINALAYYGAATMQSFMSPASDAESYLTAVTQKRNKNLFFYFGEIFFWPQKVFFFPELGSEYFMSLSYKYFYGGN
jgi:hypothetical protein